MARGVEVFKGRVRIGFKWKGKRVYETTEFKPTAKGIKDAAQLRGEIIELIKFDQFNYGKYFPDSPRSSSGSATFYDLAKKYIDLVSSEKADSTVAGYRKCINNYWLPVFEQTPIKAIKVGDVRDAIASSGLSKLSSKTYNNALTPLRGIFDLALDYEFISINPCNKIKTQKWQPPLPDPLEKHEVDAMLKHIKPEWTPYFQVAFGTGCRPSELLALIWSDVDFLSNLIKIERAYVNHKTKPTKTYKARMVEINSMSLEGLQKQKESTFLAGGLVFTISGKQIVSEKPPLLIWNAALKKSGIRHRVAYATRDTFISHALSDGANINQVAQQCGNSPAVIMKHYGKWIPQQNSAIREMWSDSKSDSKITTTERV